MTYRQPGDRCGFDEQLTCLRFVMDAICGTVPRDVERNNLERRNKAARCMLCRVAGSCSRRWIGFTRRAAERRTEIDNDMQWGFSEEDEQLVGISRVSCVS